MRERRRIDYTVYEMLLALPKLGRSLSFKLEKRKKNDVARRFQYGYVFVET